MTGVDVLAAELMIAYPEDAARVLERFPAADVAELVAELEPAAAAAILRAMTTVVGREALALADPERAGAVLAELSVPWAAALLRRAAPERIDRVLAGVDEPHRGAIARALTHDPRSVGALIDPAALALPPDVDAAFALDCVRAAHDARGDRIYVVDRDGRLEGVVGLAAVVTTAPDTRLEDLVTSELVTLRATDDTAAIAAHPAWSRWRSLPVVDADGAFLGVIRYDAVRRFVLASPSADASVVSLPVSLAELFWLGLAGVTDGLARTVAPRDGDDR